MRRYILYIVFSLFFLSSFGQYSFNKEKDKYWIYRERLKNFMVRSNGTNCKGCDILAEKRDKININPPKPETVSWADSPWMIGYWMGTLAMEYKLLIQSGLGSNSPEVMQTKPNALVSFLIFVYWIVLAIVFLTPLGSKGIGILLLLSFYLLIIPFMVLSILALVKWLKCKDCYKNNGLAIPGLLFTGVVLFSLIYMFAEILIDSF